MANLSFARDERLKRRIPLVDGLVVLTSRNEVRNGTEKLCDECAKCWCFRQKRCDGRYYNVEEIAMENGTVIESSLFTLADLNGEWPGDAECMERLVTVEDGCIYLNYAYQYPVRPLSTFTKKEMSEFMVHLMGKTWYSIFL